MFDTPGLEKLTILDTDGFVSVRPWVEITLRDEE